MVAANRIALDADTLLHHVARLKAAHGGIPAGSHVRESVQGHDGEGAEKVFHSWLATSAGRIASASDKLRASLAQNTDALQQAAEQLLRRNAISADEADDFLAVLTGSSTTTVAGAATTPVPAPAGTPTASPATPDDVAARHARESAGQL